MNDYENENENENIEEKLKVIITRLFEEIIDKNIPEEETEEKV